MSTVSVRVDAGLFPKQPALAKQIKSGLADCRIEWSETDTANARDLLGITAIIEDLQSKLNFYMHNITLKLGAIATVYVTIINRNSAAMTFSSLTQYLKGPIQASGVYLDHGNVVGVTYAKGMLLFHIVYDKHNMSSPSTFEVNTLENMPTVTDSVIEI